MNIVINLQTLYDKNVFEKIKELSVRIDIKNIYIASSLMHDVEQYIIDKFNNIDKITYISTNSLFDSNSFNKVNFELPSELINSKLITIDLLSSIRWIPISHRNKIDKLSFSMYMLYDVYNFWINFFEYNNIDIVISLNDEHSSLDYILNKAAKDKNISKIITCSIAGALASDGIEYFALYEHNKKRYIKVNQFNSVKQQINKDNYNYQEFSHQYEKTLLNKIKFIVSRLWMIKSASGNIIDKATVLSGKLLRYLYVKIKFIQQIRYIESLKKYYEKISTLNIDYNNKYVYYCLHFDPEATILPKDKIYSNQLLNIRIISSSLPDGWNLYVKEHPHQLNADLYKNIFLNQLHAIDIFRSESFYKYINELDNVQLISLKTDHNKLIENAQYIASNTGTVFREATMMKKRCITFSHKSLYSLMDNVYEVKDYNDCVKLFQEDRKPIFSSVDELFEDYTITVDDLNKRDSIILGFIIKHKLYKVSYD